MEDSSRLTAELAALDGGAKAGISTLQPQPTRSAPLLPSGSNRVIFVNRYFFPDFSASSQMLSDLAFELARSGVEVHVITSRLNYHGGLAAPLKQEILKGVTIHRVWTSGFGRFNLWGRGLDYLSFYCSMFLTGIALVQKADLLVAKTDPPLISVVCLVVSTLRQAKLVNWIQDLFPEVAAAAGIKIAKGPTGRFLRWLRDVSLRQAILNVTIGEQMKQRLIAKGLCSKRIALISNWADGDAIVPVAHDANELRQEWGLDGHFIVGYSGNLGFAHDYATLLESATRLKEDDRLRFLFIGSGKHIHTLQKESIRRGLSNMVFKPFQPRSMLRYSLGIADVHVVSLAPALEGLIVPSKFYGIAAAGRGTLNIGSVNGEIARLIQFATCGATVAPGDVDRAVRLISKWMERPEIAAAMGVNARALYDETLSHRLMFQHWKEVIGTAGIDHLVNQPLGELPPLK